MLIQQTEDQPITSFQPCCVSWFLHGDLSKIYRHLLFPISKNTHLCITICFCSWLPHFQIHEQCTSPSIWQKVHNKFSPGPRGQRQDRIRCSRSCLDVAMKAEDVRSTSHVLGVSIVAFHKPPVWVPLLVLACFLGKQQRMTKALCSCLYMRHSESTITRTVYLSDKNTNKQECNTHSKFQEVDKAEATQFKIWSF